MAFTYKYFDILSKVLQNEYFITNSLKKLSYDVSDLRLQIFIVFYFKQKKNIVNVFPYLKINSDSYNV